MIYKGLALFLNASRTFITAQVHFPQTKKYALFNKSFEVISMKKEGVLIERNRLILVPISNEQKIGYTRIYNG